MTDKALYCAGELDLFKYAEGGRGEGLRMNFLHRLMVIFLEDVGVGGIGLWAAMDGAMDALFAERKSAERSRAKEAALLFSVVSGLAAAQKSRSCSHARAVCSRYAASRALAVAKFPAVAALHEAAGDVEGASFEAACEAFKAALIARSWTAIMWAQKIADADVKVREYKKTKPVWRVFRILETTLTEAKFTPLHALSRKWYSELDPLKEAFLCWMVLIVAHILEVPCTPIALPSTAVAEEWPLNRGGAVIAWDAFVEDRHTAAGKGKTLTEFALVGAHVENESPFVVAEHKAFYVEQKRMNDAAPPVKKPRKARVVEPAGGCGAAPAAEEKEKESKKKPRAKKVPPPKAEVAAKAAVEGVLAETATFEFLVRAQVNTSASKSDVYFARDVAKGGALVVVKGPLKPEAIERVLEMQDWKRLSGLPALEARRVDLIPDRWPEGVPLGVRNKMSRTEPAAFLVCTSVLDEAAISHRISHTTRVWPATEVVDWSKVVNHVTPAALATSDTAMCDYVGALCMRWLFGISDCADRNFLLISGGTRVLSVDEEYRGKDVCFAKELRKKRCEIVRRWLAAGGYARLRTRMAAWVVPADLKVRHEALLSEATCVALFA